MKSNAQYKPEIIQNLGNGTYFYRYNIVESVVVDENGNERMTYDYEVVLINRPDYNAIVEALIAEKYSISEELSITGKYNDFVLGISEKEEDVKKYKDYRAEVLAIKKMVKNDLNIK